MEERVLSIPRRCSGHQGDGDLCCYTVLDIPLMMKSRFPGTDNPARSSVMLSKVAPSELGPVSTKDKNNISDRYYWTVHLRYCSEGCSRRWYSRSITGMKRPTILECTKIFGECIMSGDRRMRIRSLQCLHPEFIRRERLGALVERRSV